IRRGDRDVLHAPVVALDDPATLVEGEFAVDERPMVTRQPGHAVFPVLLVRLGDEDQVAVELDLPFGEHHGGAGEDGDAALEVDRTAAVHSAILDEAIEWVDRPLLALDADDVSVR